MKGLKSLILNIYYGMKSTYPQLVRRRTIGNHCTTRNVLIWCGVQMHCPPRSARMCNNFNFCPSYSLLSRSWSWIRWQSFLPLIRVSSCDFSCNPDGPAGPGALLLTATVVPAECFHRTNFGGLLRDSSYCEWTVADPCQQTLGWLRNEVPKTKGKLFKFVTSICVCYENTTSVLVWPLYLTESIFRVVIRL